MTTLNQDGSQKTEAQMDDERLDLLRARRDMAWTVRQQAVRMQFANLDLLHEGQSRHGFEPTDEDVEKIAALRRDVDALTVLHEECRNRYNAEAQRQGA